MFALMEADIAKPVDVTATILREMREEFRTEFREMRNRMDRIETRMDGVETRMDGLETGLHVVQVILVNMVGAFDRRIGSLETKVG